MMRRVKCLTSTADRYYLDGTTCPQPSDKKIGEEESSEVFISLLNAREPRVEHTDVFIC